MKIKIMSLLMIGSFILVLIPDLVDAETVTVCASGCNFTKIQDAIYASGEDDKIELYNGTYSELLLVNNKSLKIYCEDSDIILNCCINELYCTRGGTVYFVNCPSPFSETFILENEGKIHFAQGRNYLNKSEYDLAEIEFQKTYDFCKEIEDRHGAEISYDYLSLSQKLQSIVSKKELKEYIQTYLNTYRKLVESEIPEDTRLSFPFSKYYTYEITGIISIDEGIAIYFLPSIEEKINVISVDNPILEVISEKRGIMRYIGGFVVLENSSLKNFHEVWIDRTLFFDGSNSKETWTKEKAIEDANYDFEQDKKYTKEFLDKVINRLDELRETGKITDKQGNDITDESLEWEEDVKKFRQDLANRLSEYATNTTALNKKRNELFDRGRTLNHSDVYITSVFRDYDIIFSPPNIQIVNISNTQIAIQQNTNSSSITQVQKEYGSGDVFGIIIAIIFGVLMIYIDKKRSGNWFWIKEKSKK